LAVKVFNSNKYLVTFLLVHLLSQCPPAIDVVGISLSWLLCKQ